MTSLPLHHQRLQNIQRQLPNVINYFVAGPTDCEKVQMLLYPYTPFICKALYFDLECFKYLLDLYEKVKPTIEKLLESGKLEKTIDYIQTILYPFRRNCDHRTNLLHCLSGKEDIIVKLDCLIRCSVLDQLFNQESLSFPSTPLSDAIMAMETTLAEKMVELGAHIDRIDREGSPIGQAVERGHATLVKKMLEIGILY